MTIDIAQSECNRIELALDAASVPRQDGSRTLSLAERVSALVRDRDEERFLSDHRNEERNHYADAWATAANERDRLFALINTPRTDDFFEAVRIEAAHQIERWGVEHDAGKRTEDWLALYFYLLGKAARAHYAGDREKLLHHIVTVAAVALNWHRNATGVSTAMRPGVGPRPMRCVCGHEHGEHDMQDTTACRVDDCPCICWGLDDMHLHATKELSK